MGNFSLSGKVLEFPDTLQLAFNFKYGMATGVITQILHLLGCDVEALQRELRKLGIEPKRS